MLVVEDEAMLREMYQQKLKQAGYEVVSAHNAEQGLRLAKKEKPDLVLLDILLPKKNGLDCLASIRKDPSIAKSLVVAFSNYDDPEAKKTAKKLGVTAYLIKSSYTPGQIVARVRRYLE